MLPFNWHDSGWAWRASASESKPSTAWHFDRQAWDRDFERLVAEQRRGAKILFILLAFVVIAGPLLAVLLPRIV